MIQGFWRAKAGKRQTPARRVKPKNAAEHSNDSKGDEKSSRGNDARSAVDTPNRRINRCTSNWPALHQFEARFQMQKWTLNESVARRRHHDRQSQG